jgi:hypothetical protein
LKGSPYFKQAELMLRTIPHVAAETCFALKGGTAINLFVRDMPSVTVKRLKIGTSLSPKR